MQLVGFALREKLGRNPLGTVLIYPVPGICLLAHLHTPGFNHAVNLPQMLEQAAEMLQIFNFQHNIAG